MLFRARFGPFAEREAREVCARLTERGQIGHGDGVAVSRLAVIPGEQRRDSVDARSMDPGRSAFALTQVERRHF